LEITSFNWYSFFVIKLQKEEKEMIRSNFNLKEVMDSQKEGEIKVSYTELYKIISKPWVNTQEIQKICQCGEKKATKLRKIIEEEVFKSGKNLPNSVIKVVPTPLVLKYLNISENYVYEMAKKEQSLDSLIKGKK